MSDRVSIEASGDGAWNKARSRLEEYDIDMSNLEYVGIELRYSGDDLVSIELVGIDRDNHVEEPSPPERAKPTYTRPQSYDVREQPARGRILDEVAKSDGVTADSVLDLADVKKETGMGYLSRMVEWGGLETFEHEGKTYYRITDLGETVLREYRRRWSSGYSNLPSGFWPEQMGFDPLDY